MGAHFATARMIGGRLAGLRTAIVGRACRYSLGKRLFGPGSDRSVRIERLTDETMTYWARYLGISREKIKIPDKDVYTYLGLASDEVVGHVSIFEQWKSPPVAVPGWWLTGLHVNPRWRGAGVGMSICRACLHSWESDHAGTDLYLVVNTRNGPAAALFRSVGFQSVSLNDYESSLQKAYKQFRGDRWAYQIMVRRGA